MPFNPAVAPVADPFRGLGQGMQDLGVGIERALERQKADAKLFKALQEELEVRGVATKDQTTTMSLDDLIAKSVGARVKEQMDEHKMRLEAAASRERAAAMEQQMNALNLNVAKKAEAGKQMWREWMASLPEPPSQADAIKAGFNTGWAPNNPAEFVNAMRMYYPEPVFTPGQARDIEGLPGKKFVFTSRAGSGQIEEAKPSVPERVSKVFTDTGKPTKWLVTPSGQYLQDKPETTRSAEDLTMMQDTVIKAQKTLEQLRALKAAGVKKVDIDDKTGAAMDAGWFGGIPIDNAIRMEEARIAVNSEKAGLTEQEEAPPSITEKQIIDKQDVLKKIRDDYKKGIITREEARRQIQSVFKK